MPPADPRSQVRDEFVDAAFRVIDTAGPNPSMDDIARAANSSKPRLYRHFGDKYALFQAVAERIGHDIYRLVRPDLDFVMHSPRGALYKTLSGYADVIAKHPNVFTFLAQAQFAHEKDPSARKPDVGRDVSNRLTRVATGVLEAINADTAGVEIAIRAAVAAVAAATDVWLAPDEGAAAMTRDEFVDQTCVVVWGIIAAFLASKDADVDPDEPMYMVLARRATPD